VNGISLPGGAVIASVAPAVADDPDLMQDAVDSLFG
jgi:hypothetical protein